MKAMISAPELHTERLHLLDITENDADVIVKLRSDPNVYQYFVSPHKITLEEHLNWFRNIYIYDENRYDWIAFLDNEPIGIFGIKREFHYADTAEISYILSPEYYGKGYAKEAVSMLILFCKTEWKCKKVTAEIHKNNTLSINFIKRLSFTLTEEYGYFLRYEKIL